MASHLKTKIGISVISVTLIVTAHLLTTNFLAPVTIKRWSPLIPTDFKGFVPPFHYYDAAIASEIYLEYDSIQESFHAYAGQNDQQSWTKDSVLTNEATLRHEQFHFNITELHARKLNDIIKENPGKSEHYYKRKLAGLNFDLWEMQKKYDNETDHSLAMEQQDRWEYRIDSLLVLDQGWITEEISGAKVFYPSTPKPIKNNKYENPSWGFSLTSYNMGLHLTVLEHGGQIDLYKEAFVSQETVTQVEFEGNYRFSKVQALKKDSTVTSLLAWVFDEKYLYAVMGSYPAGANDSLYHETAKSFVNSLVLKPRSTTP